MFGPQDRATGDIPPPDIVRIEGVTKRFGGVLALDDVTFSIARGEVHAIVGENGAGKSTVMKVIAGVHQPDTGRIFLNGNPVRMADPLAAQRHGIAIVFQELNTFPHLSVAANVFTNHEVWSRGGMLSQLDMRRRTREVLASLNVDLDPDARAGALSVGQKQIVEIARALSLGSELVIMDEPNSALTDHETETLFAIIRRLKSQGITVVYVSHRMEEVFTICDRITVLRDGRYVGTWDRTSTSLTEIVSAMIGRPLEGTFPKRPALPVDQSPLVNIEGLTKHGRIGPVDFTIRRGEVLGLAGLEGSGIDDLFQMLFGLERPDAGRIFIEGRRIDHRSAAAAIRNGWALVPANRREQGLMLDWSIRLNMTLPILDRLVGRLGLVRPRQERSLVADRIRGLRISTDSAEKRVGQLSGGNQQKVVVAKWLATAPRVLMLNDPTRGIDVGAKREIYQLVNDLAAQGFAILLTSSELEEVVGLCDRILVMYRGRICGEFARGSVTKGELTHWVMSGAGADGTNRDGPAVTHMGQTARPVVVP